MCVCVCFFFLFWNISLISFTFVIMVIAYTVYLSYILFNALQYGFIYFFFDRCIIVPPVIIMVRYRVVIDTVFKIMRFGTPFHFLCVLFQKYFLHLYVVLLLRIKYTVWLNSLFGILSSVLFLSFFVWNAPLFGIF